MTPQHDATYREVLLLPWSWWLGGLGLAVIAGGQLAAGASGVRAVVGWGLVPAVALGLAWLSARQVRVGHGELRVPGATVPTTALGRAVPLDRAQTSAARGRTRAAGAFVPTVPWVTTAVRVDLLDPADTTPHWVVPTRRPAALAAALQPARASRDENPRRR